MKILKVTLILTFSLMVCMSNAHEVYATNFGSNVTIYDNRSNTLGDGYSYTNPKEHGWWTTGQNIGGEDQEVEPGMWPLQKWDLEGFFLKDGKTLTMVGGFDFKNGVLDGGYLYRSGSIFIDINGDAQYGINADDTVQNFGYEYAVNLNFDEGTYNVYESVQGNMWTWDTVIEPHNIYYSNPWRYRSGGQLIASGGFSYVSGLSDSDVGFLGDNDGSASHYAVTGIDLSFLPVGTTFISHFTMECGNDNLMDDAETKKAPEPASMILLGLGLIGLAGIRKKINE